MVLESGVLESTLLSVCQPHLRSRGAPDLKTPCEAQVNVQIYNGFLLDYVSTCVTPVIPR